MSELIEYVRTLSEEIGPRPATTDAEHRASEWIERTFASRGLPTEVQEFDAPHTMSWTFVMYHLLTIGCAFLSGFGKVPSWIPWPTFALSAIGAFFFWSDLDTHWGLSRLMPKGPSQNVIARYIPRARRGEKLRRIVVVAHYDSARSALPYSPGLVQHYASGFRLAKWATYATPILIFLQALPIPAIPFIGQPDRWLWYLTLAVSAYLLVPVALYVHRELFMPFVAGANNNASGVAAMFGVMERLVPEPDADNLVTGSFASVRRADFRSAREAGVVPEGAEVEYRDESPASTELPEDFRWAETSSSRPATVIRSGASDESETGEFPGASSWRSRSTQDVSWGDMDEESDAPSAEESFADAMPEFEEVPEKRGLLGLFARKRPQQDAGPRPADWLGLDEGFDARKSGRDIGSWDRFSGSDDDDDAAGGLGWKGGWAGDDPIGDPGFAANEAARIRRRTESIDRELMEKEVWFVATGAGEVGGYGMRSFLLDHGDELRDALIINLDACGTGSLHWASAEGKARRLRANPRLVGLARRVSRETDTLIKPRVLDGLATDATVALVRGFKAMSIIALEHGGLPANWHWRTDHVEEVDPELLETVATFVTTMIREG